MTAEKLSPDDDVVGLVLGACGLRDPEGLEEELMVRAVRSALPKILDQPLRPREGLRASTPREQWAELSKSECMKRGGTCRLSLEDSRHADCGWFRQFDEEERRQLNFRFWLGCVFMRAAVEADLHMQDRSKSALGVLALTLGPAELREQRVSNLQPCLFRNSEEASGNHSDFVRAVHQALLDYASGFTISYPARARELNKLVELLGQNEPPMTEPTKNVLDVLMKNMGKFLSVEDLGVKSGWPSPETIRGAIKILRDKHGYAGRIDNKRGVGYRLKR